MTEATIAALATGRPPAAIAVIRVSGSKAFEALASLTGAPLPPPRRMALHMLRDPRTGLVLDHALIVGFPGPASASGEDLAELHLHGGSAVIAGVLDALLAQPGIRLAEPGEFTRRAFANGRLDLAEVEGLADLVAAETAAQRDQALMLSGGALGRAAEAWRSRCIETLAEAEAALDFAEDESDVAERLQERAAADIVALVAEIDMLLEDAQRGRRLREGLSIAIIGAPNAGKSSLLNALSVTDAAIVTAIPGTTRDPVEVALDLGGVAAVLVDTAGLRDTDDPVEAEGIRRARLRAAQADLVLHLIGADSPGLGVEPVAGVVVVNKIDLGVPSWAPHEAHLVSATQGQGIAALRGFLAEWAKNIVRPGEPALLSHARHREAFADAAESLRDAAMQRDPVLRAESLRLAARALGRIAGRVDVEDVLDHIFSRFCIGK
jgi:tRNA modification GTPase